MRKNNQTGRSMVEMLGVLAIIGVLSVGAIAGYQKAMFKYKLNKHAQSFNLFLNNAIQYSGKLHSSINSVDSNNMEYLAEMFLKLNLIPDDFTYIDRTNIADNFGNYMWVYSSDGTGSAHFSGIGIELTSSHYNKPICYNLVNAIQENHRDLWQVFNQQYDGLNVSQAEKYYGDRFCTSKSKCIATMSLTDIDILCNNCSAKSCRLYVLWK